MWIIIVRAVLSNEENDIMHIDEWMYNGYHIAQKICVDNKHDPSYFISH